MTQQEQQLVEYHQSLRHLPPAPQLERWAYLGQGPRNSGTQHKPMYHEDDVREWRKAREKPWLDAVEEAMRE